MIDFASKLFILFQQTVQNLNNWHFFNFLQYIILNWKREDKSQRRPTQNFDRIRFLLVNCAVDAYFRHSVLSSFSN